MTLEEYLAQLELDWIKLQSSDDELDLFDEANLFEESFN